MNDERLLSRVKCIPCLRQEHLTYFEWRHEVIVPFIALYFSQFCCIEMNELWNPNKRNVTKYDSNE